MVTDLLVEHFANMVDYNFTSEMEQKLDDIAEGEREWVPVIRDFYGPFDETLRKAERDMRSVKGEARVIDEACPTCGSPLAIRLGRNGEFLACTNGECQFTGDLERSTEGGVRLARQPELAEGAQSCDKCGRPMMVKQGRYGPFLACTGYPECKNIRNLTKTREGTLAVAEQATEWNCPKCAKPMIRKQGRWGPYLACTDYPDCRTIQKLDREGRPKPPTRVTERVCPECNQHQLALKEGRYGPFLSCTGYPRCRYIEKLPADGSTPRILSDEEVEALRPAKPKRAAAGSKATGAATHRGTSKTAAKSSAKATARRSNGTSNGRTTGKSSSRSKSTRRVTRDTVPG